WALHEGLGEHIKQAGSVVADQRLRFDFSHHKGLTIEEIRRIEDLINVQIRENLPVNKYELKYEEAQNRSDIKQFFGEKYGSSVRVVDIDYSKELCGGTHTHSLGTIGLFRITKESSIAAGIRRIEAVTGIEAEQLHRQNEDTLLKLAEVLKVPVHLTHERLEKVLEENKQLAQELKGQRLGQLSHFLDSLAVKQEMQGGVPVISAEVPLSMEDLRLGVDLLSEKVPGAVIILGAVFPEKCQIMVKVSDQGIKQGISANDLIKLMMPIVEGSGGGKQQSAQGGGKAPQKLTEALQKAREWLSEKLG
ncbi:MAG: DHHA1 domain-containing protein, partial [Parachlamydia sp.]|nr:DHHA1 domain-containing protein [Parachlamydia sp.]